LSLIVALSGSASIEEMLAHLHCLDKFKGRFVTVNLHLCVSLQRQMSVAQIESAEIMEKGKLKTGGLSDPRMGTVDRKIKCETCMAGMAECPGHFGHLELAKPMFHIGFIKTVLSIMRCVCFNCSKILADEVSLGFTQDVCFLFNRIY